MESVVREYTAWRERKQREFQTMADEQLRDHKSREEAAGRHIPYYHPHKPDLSFQAFLEEYEDSMPLDH